MSMKEQYGQQKDSYHAKIMAKSIAILVVCIILTLICLVPIYILIVNSTHSTYGLGSESVSFLVW